MMRLKASRFERNITFSFLWLSDTVYNAAIPRLKKQPQSPTETFQKPREVAMLFLKRRPPHPALSWGQAAQFNETSRRQTESCVLTDGGLLNALLSTSRWLDWISTSNDLGADGVAATTAAAVRRVPPKPSKRHVWTRLHCCRKFQKLNADRC